MMNSVSVLVLHVVLLMELFWWHPDWFFYGIRYDIITRWHDIVTYVVPSVDQQWWVQDAAHFRQLNVRFSSVGPHKWRRMDPGYTNLCPPVQCEILLTVTVGSLGWWEHKRLGLSYNIYWNAVSYKKQADDEKHMNTIYVQI